VIFSISFGFKIDFAFKVRQYDVQFGQKKFKSTYTYIILLGN